MGEARMDEGTRQELYGKTRHHINRDSPTLVEGHFSSEDHPPPFFLCDRAVLSRGNERGGSRLSVFPKRRAACFLEVYFSLTFLQLPPWGNMYCVQSVTGTMVCGRKK